MTIAAFSSAALVVLAVAANSGATVFLKKAVGQDAGLSAAFPFLPLPALALYGAALFFYGAAFVLYALTLQRLPVSLAYLTITALTQGVLLFYGTCAIGERLTLLGWVGVVLTLSGLALIVFQRS